MRWALRASVLATVVACGGDGGAGGGGSGGGVDNGGMSESCELMARDVTEPDDKVLTNLTVSGETLVYLSGDRELGSPYSIRSVNTDGSSRVMLHTPTGQRRVRSVVAYGDNLFFYEENEEVVPKRELFKLALAGGTPARIGSVARENGYIFGVDATHVYLARTTDQPVGSVFERVEIATGTLSVMATSTGTGTPGHVMLSGNDVFFHATMTGSGSAAKHTVFGFPKDASNVTPTVLWQAEAQDPCGFPLGGLTATPTKLSCGFSAVASRNRDGSEPVVLIEAAPLAPPNIVVASDAENIYMIETSRSETNSARLKRTPSDVADVTNLACDLAAVSNKLVDAFFPIAYEWEVVVGASEVFWIERTSDDAGERYQLRAATK